MFFDDFAVFLFILYFIHLKQGVAMYRIIHLLVLLSALSFSCQSAEVYKCTIDGVTTFDQHPCGDDAIKTNYQAKTPKTLHELNWYHEVIYNEYSNTFSCLLTTKGSSVRPIGQRQSQSVVLRLANGEFSYKTNEIFDHNTFNFELKIDKKTFTPSKRPSAKEVSFGFSTDRIINALLNSQSKSIKGLVVTWPFNDKPYMVKYALSDFKYSYQKYQNCMNKHRKHQRKF